MNPTRKAPSWGLTEGRTLQRGFINIDSEHDLETVFSYSLDYLSVSYRSFKEWCKLKPWLQLIILENVGQYPVFSYFKMRSRSYKEKNEGRVFKHFFQI